MFEGDSLWISPVAKSDIWIIRHKQAKQEDLCVFYPRVCIGEKYEKIEEIPWLDFAKNREIGDYSSNSKKRDVGCGEEYGFSFLLAHVADWWA